MPVCKQVTIQGMASKKDEMKANAPQLLEAYRALDDVDEKDASEQTAVKIKEVVQTLPHLLA